MEEEMITHEISIHPEGEGSQEIIRLLADGKPEISSMEDQELAQFLADLVSATTFACVRGGDMTLEDLHNLITLNYKLLDGYDGVEQ